MRLKQTAGIFPIKIEILYKNAGDGISNVDGRECVMAFANDNWLV